MQGYTPDTDIVKLALIDYEAGLSMAAIGEKYSMSNGWMYNVLKRHGIKARPKWKPIKYAIDDTFFERIDSHAKATCLGFIWADGCISSAGTIPYLSITLSEKDLDYLEWMNRSMRNQRPIRHYGRFVSLVAYNRSFVAHLMDKGVYRRKSLSIGAPDPTKVPDAYLASFVLGVFDGDGSISFGTRTKCYANICGTDAFCQWLKTLLLDRLGIGSSITYSETKSGPPLARIGIGGNQQVMRFMEWMYENAPYRLERKHTVYRHLRAMYDENKVRAFTAEETASHLAHRRAVRSTWTLSEDAKRRIGRARYRSACFKAPDGTIYRSNGTQPFATEMGLCRSNLSKLLRKPRWSCKGWKAATEAEVASAVAAGTLVDKVY